MPHSEIPGSTIARISPGLIAACYVLHRLSVPRHPPNALHYALEHHIQRQTSELRHRRTALTADAANLSLEDTCWTRSSIPSSTSRPATEEPDVSSSVTSHSLLHHSINKTQRKCHHFSAANRNFMPSTRCGSLVTRHRNGGGERDRTDDLLLAKQALSQLSYTPGSGRHFCHLAQGAKGWWAREDLNLRPHAYQARALTS